MNKALLYFFFIGIITTITAQTNAYRIEFEDFETSRGDSNQGLSVVLPHSEIVYLNNILGNSSGLGATFNFHGNVVVVDQFERMNDGSMQIVLRREDGKNFFGHEPTLKALLKIPSDTIPK